MQCIWQKPLAVAGTRAYSKLVWSHKGNKVATNGSALLLACVPTPDQFSNWSRVASLSFAKIRHTHSFRLNKQNSIDNKFCNWLQQHNLISYYQINLFIVWYNPSLFVERHLTDFVLDAPYHFNARTVTPWPPQRTWKRKWPNQRFIHLAQQ